MHANEEAIIIRAARGRRCDTGSRYQETREGSARQSQGPALIAMAMAMAGSMPDAMFLMRSIIVVISIRKKWLLPATTLHYKFAP
jgi:hypothetical protein